MKFRHENFWAKKNGAEGSWTPDPLHAMQVLSQPRRLLHSVGVPTRKKDKKRRDWATSLRMISMKNGAEGSWTPDPLHAMQVLSQLSYSP